jgi:hypothetical protein
LSFGGQILSAFIPNALPNMKVAIEPTSPITTHSTDPHVECFPHHNTQHQAMRPTPAPVHFPQILNTTTSSTNRTHASFSA